MTTSETESARRDLTLAMLIIRDLDRCEHGRHAPDVCGQCGGRSHGNPLAGIKIGNDLEAKPHTVADLYAILPSFYEATDKFEAAVRAEERRRYAVLMSAAREAVKVLRDEANSEYMGTQGPLPAGAPLRSAADHLEAALAADQQEVANG